jgi:hypothetical protein
MADFHGAGLFVKDGQIWLISYLSLFRLEVAIPLRMIVWAHRNRQANFSSLIQAKGRPGFSFSNYRRNTLA